MAVHLDGEVCPGALDDHLVDALLPLEKAQRNSNAKPLQGRFENRAPSIRHRKGEIVSGVAVVLLQASRFTGHPETKPKRAGLVEGFIPLDAAQIDRQRRRKPFGRACGRV